MCSSYETYTRVIITRIKIFRLFCNMFHVLKLLTKKNFFITAFGKQSSLFSTMFNLVFFLKQPFSQQLAFLGLYI